jgi:hypothetical protein
MPTPGQCQCELIAKVREETLAAAVRRVTALQVSLIDVRFNPNDPADYRQAVIFRQCIDAIKGDQP